MPSRYQPLGYSSSLWVPSVIRIETIHFCAVPERGHLQGLAAWNSWQLTGSTPFQRVFSNSCECRAAGHLTVRPLLITCVVQFLVRFEILQNQQVFIVLIPWAPKSYANQTVTYIYCITKQSSVCGWYIFFPCTPHIFIPAKIGLIWVFNGSQLIPPMYRWNSHVAETHLLDGSTTSHWGDPGKLGADRADPHTDPEAASGPADLATISWGSMAKNGNLATN